MNTNKEKAIKVIESLLEARRLYANCNDEFSVGYILGIDRAVGYIRIVFDIEG